MSAGFAVKDGETDTILVNTVSETERAAMVNYLVTACGHHVTNGWIDEHIAQVFRIESTKRKAVLIPITVTEA